MAGFETHITVSTAVGIGLGWYGATQMGLPVESAAIGAGLCSIAGMLPDLDSDSGVPARETLCFVSAIIPMLLLQRLGEAGFSHQQMVCIAAPMYLFLRFVIGGLFKRLTVHRGMFHSIPAIIIAACLTYLICETNYQKLRLFCAGAVALGYLTHLALDEVWSVSLPEARLKSSFGTALKLYSNDVSANAACYGMLILVGLLSVREDLLQDLAPGIAGSRPKVIHYTQHFDDDFPPPPQ